jgi:catechol 2,3-dioxygenase-like lactoylglutathione lyase family enzyme
MLHYKTAFSGFSVDDLQKAKAFYGEKLGLKTKESDGGLHISVTDETVVFAYAKPNHEPASFTILNFLVEDIEKAVQELKDAGITFENYPGTDTGEDGISRSPNGPMIAWFKDPFGNVLSVLQG